MPFSFQAALHDLSRDAAREACLSTLNQPGFPDCWDEYIGQVEVKKYLLAVSHAALQNTELRLPHLAILSPGDGLGRKALAQLVVRQCARRVTYVNAVTSLNECRDSFTYAESGDIIIYENFHRTLRSSPKVRRVLEEYLTEGILPRSFREQAPQVTIIALINESRSPAGKILESFRQIRLDPYNEAEATHITLQLSRKLYAVDGLPPLHDSLASKVSRACGNRPGSIQSLLLAIKELVNSGVIAASVDGRYDMDEVLARSGLTATGATIEADTYLNLIENIGPQLIRSALDAELAAARFLRQLGFKDALATPVGADGGIDVESEEVCAQVKAEVVLTARPVIQQIFGVAKAEGKIPVFFSLAGYTQEAMSWANRTGVALFRFDLQGVPEALNQAARTLHPNKPSLPTI